MRLKLQESALIHTQEVLKDASSYKRMLISQPAYFLRRIKF